MIKLDSWINTIFGFGDNTDPNNQTKFVSGHLSINELSNLFAYNALANKIVCKIVDSAFKRGFTIKSDVDFDRDLFYKYLTSLKALDTFKKCCYWSRLYGNAILFFGLDSDNNLQYESNLMALDFLKDIHPDYFTISKYNYHSTQKTKELISINGTPIHPSRYLKFDGISAPVDIQDRLMNLDLSVLQVVYEDLKSYGVSWQAVEGLLSKAETAVYKLPNYYDSVQAGQYEAIAKRLGLANRQRSVHKALILDKEEEFQQFNANFSNIPQIINELQAKIAGACDMPMTILFGMSPAGLNATGESDLENWYGSIEDYQDKISPNFESFITILLKNFLKNPKVECSIEFVHPKPVNEIQKLDNNLKQTQIDNSLITSGLYTADEIIKTRFKNGDMTYNYPNDVDIETIQKRILSTPDFEMPEFLKKSFNNGTSE